MADKGKDSYLDREAAVDQAFQNPDNEPIPVDIDHEMRQSFIDYAMSVITDRALPDVRDGLKPVHRRILYSMYTQGFTHDKPYRKCATTVGDVLGRFHPHGDASVYDALVRLAQDFSMRHPLVDGHGNFGSRDGDPPAAYRYTEARLTRLSGEMMKDLNKDTVDFQPNYDDRLEEPIVLPAAFPNLLVSGSTGIAVGMTTNIPPHNMREVVAGAIHLIDNPDADSDDLMEFIPGPDFPTGAQIIGTSGIRSAYRTGRGRIVVRGHTEIEEMRGGRYRILIHSLPYMVNKARLIERIADLVKDKRIEGISDVRDESDRHDQVRVVVELKRDATPMVVLNQLYRHTQLQDTFSTIMIALVEENGKYVPRLLSLSDILGHFIEHQRSVIGRRTKFDLDKAEARRHLVEGLQLAIDHIDEVIRIIRGSDDEDQAKVRLSERFGLSEKQSQHVVDMRLGRLSGLEREKLNAEHRDLTEKIDYFNRILSEDSLMRQIMKEELQDIANRFGDDRRSEFELSDEFDLDDESLIEDEDAVITLTHAGYIKRMHLDEYRSQRRGGRGVSGMQTREGDVVKQILTTTALKTILFFTNTGRVYRLKSYQIPESKRQARGLPIVNLLHLDPEEWVVGMLEVDKFDEDSYLIMATSLGQIKKTAMSEYANVHKGGIIAIALREGDKLIGVDLADNGHDIVLISRQGLAIRFPESDVRDTGRNTMGVKGMNLSDDDAVISSLCADCDDTILVVSENGFGKRSAIDQYRPQKRGGKGLITYKVTRRTGVLVEAALVNDYQDILLVNDKGIIIRLATDEIPILGRSTSGVTLMRSSDGKVVSMAVVDHENVEEETDPDPDSLIEVSEDDFEPDNELDEDETEVSLDQE
ncbi:MAG TPA: DNA gyrase subunit A [Oscillospiraceae bacterium]|nr:DNA gyrase subunit A [Oscillospiraceae bacterium]